MARRLREKGLSCWGWLALGCGLTTYVGLIVGIIVVAEVSHTISDWGEVHRIQKRSQSLQLGTVGNAGSEDASTRDDGYELILAVCLGLGLSAACGFRIFIPPLILSIAQRSGHVVMATEWQSVFGSDFALIVLTIAAVVEIMAYYVPWLDNALDSIALPASTVAGIILMAACTTHVDPYLRWAFVVIAGGGQAGLVQSVTTVARLGSSATTGGLANPVIATIEAGGSGIMAALAIVIPLITAPIVVVGTVIGVVRYRRHVVTVARRRRVEQRMKAVRQQETGAED